MVLSRLGFRYGRLRKMYRKSANHRRREDTFIIVDYANIRQMELEGKGVVVFQDESYCHQYHAKGMGWYNYKTQRGTSKPRVVGVVV